MTVHFAPERRGKAAAFNRGMAFVATPLVVFTDANTMLNAEAVREMIRRANEKKKGTVLMSVSGHLHTDHQAVVDGVVHFDVNTVRNGLWLPEAREHYGSMTYPFVNYDAEGKEIGHYDRPLSELRMAAQTWFFDRPLSTVVTVSGEGSITIEGSTADWYGNVVPDAQYEVNARISDGRYDL